MSRPLIQHTELSLEGEGIIKWHWGRQGIILKFIGNCIEVEHSGQTFPDVL